MSSVVPNLPRVRISPAHLPRKALIGLVRFYQLALSPWMGPGHCRFTPTCSHYAIEAIERFGAIRGFILAAWRILRCNPWNHGPTFDPPRWFGEPLPGNEPEPPA